MAEITLHPKSNNKLAFLVGSVQTMFNIIDGYIEYHRDLKSFDVPYHYNERATLSIFAGAIWRSHPDNYVLEEFCTDKSGTDLCYRGRQDIWFRMSGQSCCAEAKQLWIPLYRTRKTADRLFTVVRQELAAAETNLPKGSADRPLGILFAVPYILETNISDARDHLQLHHDVLARELDPWCARERCHMLWGKYVCEELLEKDACYEWTDGHVGSCPSVDILICSAEK